MTAPRDRLGPDARGWPAALRRRMPVSAADRTVRRSERKSLSAAERAGFFPWVPVWLAVGIALGLALPRQLRTQEWLCVAVAALLALAISRTAYSRGAQGQSDWTAAAPLRAGSLALALILAGTGLLAIRSALVEAPVLGWRYYGPIEGRVIEIDRSVRDRIRLTLNQVRLKDVRPHRTPERVRLSLLSDKVNLPQIGQKIRIIGHLGPPPGPAAPGSFDFRETARFQRLGAIGYTRNPVETLGPPEGGGWRIHRTRMAISATIQDRIGGQPGAVAAALMTGDRSGIEERTNEMMRASNLYHIISISGLHMSMLAGFIYASLRLLLAGGLALGLPLPQAIHKAAATGALLAAAGYLWLSGGGVATERAFVMVAVMLGAILCDRRAISLRTVALAATIILIYNPETLASPGFQMSFAATIALILSFGPWQRVSPHIPPWLRPLAILVISSLVAGLATAPIATAHFQRMAHYGLLANLLSVPVMGTLVMPAGIIAGILAPVGLAGPALFVMGLGTGWMLRVAEFVQGLQGAVSAAAQPPPMVLPLAGFGAITAVLSWRKSKDVHRLDPYRLGFGTGIAMLALAFFIWFGAKRPLLLIAPEGEAAGLMTAGGRALSKATGGSFIVDTWLREDGDLADQAQAAGRAAWAGDRRSRVASMGHGWEIWHLTGKDAGSRARAACQPDRIVVTSGTIPSLPVPTPCLAFDLPRLRKTGALAIAIGPAGPVILSADQGRLTFP
jgi:competence protein ComEC